VWKIRYDKGQKGTRSKSNNTSKEKSDNTKREEAVARKDKRIFKG